MSQNWAEVLLFICVVAQFFCVTASTTSASRMMFAFSRDRAVPGHQLWRRVVDVTACRCGRCSAIALFAAHPDDPGGLELPRRLRGRHGDRGDRPLHRVHPPGLPPLAQGRQLGRAAGLEPRQALQVDRHRRDPLGRARSRSSSSSRCTRSASRGRTTSPGSCTNYTILWFAGIGLDLRRLVGALRASWFKGPVRMGTEEELERYEEEFQKRGGTARGYRKLSAPARAARLRRQAPERARPPGRAAPAHAFRGSRRSASRPPSRRPRRPPCPRRRSPPPARSPPPRSSSASR